MKKVFTFSILFLISIVMIGCEKQNSNDDDQEGDPLVFTQVPLDSNQFGAVDWTFVQTEFLDSDEWLCNIILCKYTGYLSNQRTVITYSYHDNSFNLYLYEGIDSEIHVHLKYYNEVFHMVEGIGFTELEYDIDGLISETEEVVLNQMQIETIDYFLNWISLININ